MPLTNCPECGHQVSTTALACPNCGYSLKAKPTEQTTDKRALIVGGLLIGTVVGLFLPGPLKILFFICPIAAISVLVYPGLKAMFQRE